MQNETASTAFLKYGSVFRSFTENLEKTENSLIFIERDPGISPALLESKLDILREALLTEDDQTVKEALRSVVPTFYTPEEINATATTSAEMRQIAN